MLAPYIKQIMRPVTEVESLRGNHVNIIDMLIKGRDYFEVLGLSSPTQDNVECIRDDGRPSH